VDVERIRVLLDGLMTQSAVLSSTALLLFQLLSCSYLSFSGLGCVPSSEIIGGGLYLTYTDQLPVWVSALNLTHVTDHI